MKEKSLLISLLLIIVSGLVGYFLGKIGEVETRSFNTNKEIFLSTLEEISQFSDYFTVNWKELSEQNYTLYRCPGLPIDKYDLGMFPTPCEDYDLLMKAKLNFHKATTKARVLGSSKVVEAIENVENGFDEVIDNYFSNEYYLRAFGDAYQKVMPKKFSNLERAFRVELATN